MQGRKEYQPELFSYVDLEKLIPQSHLRRKIDRVLDFRFIRDLTKDYDCEKVAAE